MLSQVSLTDVPANHSYRVQQLCAHMNWLTWMLSGGNRFLLGDVPSATDITAYHVIWFLRENTGGQAERLLPIGKLSAWYDRVTAIGHGKPQAMSATEALAIGRTAAPAAPGIAADGDPSGLKPGQRVSVTPDDMGKDPVTGVLVAADTQEIIIRRSDPDAGEMQVHFPRAGFNAKAT